MVWRRALPFLVLLAVLAMARLTLEEAIRLGLLDPSMFRGGRFASSAALVGGIQPTPFWRIPPIFRSGIYAPRFGLGPLRLGLGLSPGAPAVGAPGAVPTGRPAARRRLTPEEQAVVIEQMRAVGALPQPGVPVTRPRVMVGRGATPAAAAARPAAPVAAPATDASLAADLRQALGFAGTAARLGSEVTEVLAGQPGFYEGVSPEVMVALAEQRAGERGEVAPGAFLTPVEGGFRLPSGEIVRNPSAMGGPVGVQPDFSNWGVPPPGYVPQDLGPGGIYLSPELLRELGIPEGAGVRDGIVPASFLPAGRAVGAGPVAGPGSAQGGISLSSLARAARPAFRLAIPALTGAAGAAQLAVGAETGDPRQIARGALGTASGAAGVGGATGAIAPNVARAIGGAASLGGIGLGLATGDPASLIPPVFSGLIPGLVTPAATAGAIGAAGGSAAALGAGGAGAGGLAAGAGALGGGAAAGGVGGGAAGAGLGAVGASLLGGAAALVPIISMIVGGLREADIERGYGRQAKEAASALTSSPDYQTLGSNLARYRGGDRSVLPSLISAAELAAIAADRLAQPKGGTGLGAARVVDAIYRATQGTPGYEAVVRGVAGSQGYDETTSAARDPYQFLIEKGALQPPTLPAGYKIPEPATPTRAPGPFGTYGQPSALLAGPFGAPPQPQVDPYKAYRSTSPVASAPAPGPSVPGPFGTYITPTLQAGPFGAPPLHAGGIVPRTGTYAMQAGEVVLPSGLASALGRTVQAPAGELGYPEGYADMLRRQERRIPSQREGDIGVPGGAEEFKRFYPQKEFEFAPDELEPIPRMAPETPQQGFVRMAQAGGGEPPGGGQFPASAILGDTEGRWRDLLEGDSETSRMVWKILQGHARPGDDALAWFVDSRQGVPFQAKDNPDPDRVWRLVFSPGELAEAWGERGTRGWPILLRPTDLDLERRSTLNVIESARVEQYETPGFRIDYMRERGQPPEGEPPGASQQNYDAYRRAGYRKKGFVTLEDEEAGLGGGAEGEDEAELGILPPEPPEVLTQEEEEPLPEAEEEDAELEGAAR